MISDVCVCASITEMHSAAFIYIVDGGVCVWREHFRRRLSACGADWAERLGASDYWLLAVPAPLSTHVPSKPYLTVQQSTDLHRQSRPTFPCGHKHIQNTIIH